MHRLLEKISGSAIVTAAIDSSAVTTRIRDSIFRNAHGVLGNNAIDISASGNATAGFIVEGNKLDTLMRVSTFAATGSTSSRKMTGKVLNNDLDDTRGSAYGCIISDFSNPSLDIGITTVTLTEAQMPQHTHTLQATMVMFRQWDIIENQLKKRSISNSNCRSVNF